MPLIVKMFIEGVTEVCRLCLKSENLGSVFDLQFENESMTNVIFITTGVEVSELLHKDKKLFIE